MSCKKYLEILQDYNRSGTFLHPDAGTDFGIFLVQSHELIPLYRTNAHLRTGSRVHSDKRRKPVCEYLVRFFPNVILTLEHREDAPN